ncbi:hypothetical protein LA635_0604 [Erwinia amylovora LA635]|nr:hypothetical protein LA635_0604 [Erwinia amylovora LA635]CDK17595.1 hypothetical protein LA636_0603 [Erwinia amylovora LA636]CDK20964.1 hypothetical protein LA637_0604 [Erwinia amylovora LA637]
MICQVLHWHLQFYYKTNNLFCDGNLVTYITLCPPAAQSS